MSEWPAVIAEFNDWSGLLNALRLAREHRNISMEVLDELGGMPKGLAGKVLGAKPQRRLDVLSLHQFLWGLGVKCLVVDDPETLALIQKAAKTRNKSYVRADGVHILISRRRMAELASRGARALNGRRSAHERRAHAQAAANARWRAVRARSKAAAELRAAQAQARRRRSAGTGAATDQAPPP